MRYLVRHPGDICDSGSLWRLVERLEEVEPDIAIIDVLNDGVVIDADDFGLRRLACCDRHRAVIGSVEPYKPRDPIMTNDPTFATVASAVEIGLTYLSPKARHARHIGDIAALTIMGESTDGIVPMNEPYPSQRNARAS